MLTIVNPIDAEILVGKGDEEFRFTVKPNIFNKFQLFLTGKMTKGVEIIGVGPLSMRAYYSLLDYGNLVGTALAKGYRVFLIKDGKILGKGDWYLEFIKRKE